MVVLEVAAAAAAVEEEDAVALLLPCTVFQLAEGVTKPEAGATETEAMETAPATANRLLTTTMVSFAVLSSRCWPVPRVPFRSFPLVACPSYPTARASQQSQVIVIVRRGPKNQRQSIARKERGGKRSRWDERRT